MTTLTKITSVFVVFMLAIACRPSDKNDTPGGPEAQPDSVATTTPSDRDTTSTSADSTGVQ